LSHAHVSDPSAGHMILHRSIKYLLAISLPLMSGIFVAAQPLVRLLYGDGFEPSVQVVRIMACCIPLSFLFELLWRLLAAHDQQHLMLRAQVMMMLVRVVGGYLLIRSLASLGAGINTCLFLAGSNLLLGIYAQRNGTRLHIYRLAWRLSLAALVTGAVAAILINRSDLWVVALAAASLYGIMVILLKGLSADDLALLRRICQVRTAV
jgi:O-antigen/teichoic acid export membrane protein